jgi:hypothetical protein
MVGLNYLKHTCNLSDEEVVAQWTENPYWQYFCGETNFQHQLPIDPSQMTRFRKRIGDAGCEFMRGLTNKAGIVTKTVSTTSLSIVNVYTAVQEKAVAFPTDARPYHKARAALVRTAKRLGIPLRQSYERVSKLALAKNDPEIQGWRYGAMVTSLELPTLQIWRLYRGAPIARTASKNSKPTLVWTVSTWRISWLPRPHSAWQCSRTT